MVVAEMSRHTWMPGRAATFEACEPFVQELVFPPPDEPVAAVLLPEQAATASTSAAAMAADMVTLPIVLTRVYPLLV